MDSLNINTFIANYNQNEITDWNDNVASAAELTKPELEALYNIENWINKKIPELVTLANLSNSEWSIKCRAYKPLPFDAPATSNLGPAATVLNNTRLITLPRQALPLFLSNQSDQAELKAMWEEFWEREFGDKEYSMTSVLAVLRDIHEKVNHFTPEERQQLFEGCMWSLREWSDDLPETPTGIRKTIENLSSRDAFKRTVEARITQGSIATKQELKAILTHECGHLFNHEEELPAINFLAMFGPAILPISLGLVLYMGYDSSGSDEDLNQNSSLLTLFAVASGAVLYWMKSIPKLIATQCVFQQKLRELDADKFVSNLSTKYCLAAVPYMKKNLADVLLITSPKRPVSQLASVSNVFGRIFSPIDRIDSLFLNLMQSLYLKVSGLRSMKNPEDIVPGAVTSFSMLPHLEPATRWQKFRDWSADSSKETD